jgi:hypothetical protein
VCPGELAWSHVIESGFGEIATFSATSQPHSSLGSQRGGCGVCRQPTQTALTPPKMFSRCVKVFPIGLAWSHVIESGFGEVATFSAASQLHSSLGSQRGGCGVRRQPPQPAPTPSNMFSSCMKVFPLGLAWAHVIESGFGEVATFSATSQPHSSLGSQRGGCGVRRQPPQPAPTPSNMFSRCMKVFPSGLAWSQVVESVFNEIATFSATSQPHSSLGSQRGGCGVCPQPTQTALTPPKMFSRCVKVFPFGLAWSHVIESVFNEIATFSATSQPHSSLGSPRGGFGCGTRCQQPQPADTAHSLSQRPDVREFVPPHRACTRLLRHASGFHGLGCVRAC